MTPHADEILAIIRRCLERGQSVDIDGIGRLRMSRAGRLKFEPELRPRVFIAYVKEDLALVRRLHHELAAAGCAPWLDKEELLAGQNWPRAIERAIGTADFFVACFSRRALAKRGQFQCELRYALDCTRRLPLEETFLIPVRLEPCRIPRSITDQVQYVDLFPDWEHGIKRIVRAVHSRWPRRPDP